MTEEIVSDLLKVVVKLAMKLLGKDPTQAIIAAEMDAVDLAADEAQEMAFAPED